MTKKEYIIAVIDALPNWEMGKQIKSGVINNIYNDDTINKLVIILNKAMNEICEQIKKHHMLERIEQIKEEEKAKENKKIIIEEILSTLSNSTLFSSLSENGIKSTSSGEQDSIPKKYQVFVSSTFSDLINEREKVSKTIMSLGCIVAGMELFPASNMEQFEYIKRIIDESDYYVLIIGGRYGSLTKEGISYTEKEFDYAKQKGIPILAFLHKNLGNIPLDKSEIDSEKREKLLSFRTKAKTGRLVRFWESADELCLNVSTSLSQEFISSPSKGWIRK